MNKQNFFEDGLIILGFLGAVGACFLIFHYLLEINYLSWYLENGIKISWTMAFLALVWGDLNKFPSLISAYPSEYIGSYFLLLAKFFMFQAVTTVAKPTNDRPIASSYSLDSKLAFLLNFVLTITVLAWAVVIVPVQYFLFVICGAPARKIICSQQKIEGSETDWFSGELSQKPFAVTAAFTGMFLWALDLILRNYL